MTYNNSKSKFIKLPYEINLANHINDNFTVNFKPNTATLFRNSGEFTKFIDDDYQRYVMARTINNNASVDFGEKDFKRKPEGSTDYHNMATPESIDEADLLAEEARRRNISVERLRTILDDILLLPKGKNNEPQVPTEEYERDMMTNQNVDVKGVRKEGEAKLGEEDMSPKKKSKKAERKARRKERAKSASQQQKDMRNTNRAKEARDELASERKVQEEVKRIEAQIAKEKEAQRRKEEREEARKEAQQRAILRNNAKKEAERLKAEKEKAKEEARKEAQQRANLTSNKATASSSSSSRPQPYSYPELSQKGPPNLQLMRDLLEQRYLNEQMTYDEYIFYGQMRGAEGDKPWGGYRGLTGKQKTNALLILKDMYEKYRQKK